jgi:cell division protein FtsB
MRRAVWALLVVVVLGGIVFLFVLPGRTWLEQGRAMSKAETQLSVLSQENQALNKRAADLQSTAYVEQLAREEYGLVRPGEKAYGILFPPNSTTTTVPAHSASSRSRR